LDIIERALSRVGAKDGAFGGTPRPDLTAGFCLAKTGNRLVRQKACETVRRQYAMTFETGLGKAMTGAARRQSNWTPRRIDGCSNLSRPENLGFLFPQTSSDL
jgi:hypothetical protein